MYGARLFVLKMIIAFYLFMVLVEIVQVFGKPSLIQGTRNTFKYYIGFHLFAFALLSFSMSVSGDGWVAFKLISSIDVLIILFLIGAATDSLKVNYVV